MRASEYFDKAVIVYANALHLNVENKHFRSRLISCALIINEEFKSTLERIKKLKLETDVHVLISIIGQFYLNKNKDLALKLLKIANETESNNVNFKVSTLGALINAYYLIGDMQLAMDYLKIQLNLALKSSKFCFWLIFNVI